ncbi:MAG TPA: lipopolysaccharide biosynthesis protein [Acidobacteriaceae bacterium]|jgi:capsule polysaccharide export protein KpsE/RkpR|nr:lipopolysaccharide biosynthesis protein [Acidobacteriaceae bacterium]
MSPGTLLSPLEMTDAAAPIREPLWALRALVLWKHRRMLARITGAAFLVSLGLAFSIPKQYKSVTSIMPPDQQSAGATMLAALASRSSGTGLLGSLATGLLGSHSSGALFMDLLRSGTVSNHLIDRFSLQHVYRKRYRIDTARRLAHLTTITEDKKSGVITIAVEDTCRVRARDLAQAYLDELNQLVTRTNTSAAHRERLFIEQRLNAVQTSLEQAELELSRFSSRSSAIDIREQTRAMVDAGARVQGELLVEQSGLQSLRQIYGDDNVRVRESEARIATLQGQLTKMTGSSTPPKDDGAPENSGELYPPLRQLPRLAVPYTDLYRRVRTQEAVFELLTQQFEVARIDEARDVPAINVIDPPGIPEKKSSPPRLLLSLLLTLTAFASASAFILMRDRWAKISEEDPRRILAADVLPVLRRRVRSITRARRGAA